MTTPQIDPPDPQQRRDALSRWDDEATRVGAARPPATNAHAPALDVTNAEYAELRTRVIALENLVIALLATGPDRQRELARDMAVYIMPRPGYTPHPLTIHAAELMTDLVARAERFAD